MRKQKFYLLFIICFNSISLLSQNKVSVFTYLGGTVPNNKFISLETSNVNIEEAHHISFNYGAGIQLTHANRWFTTYECSNFNQWSGLTVNNQTTNEVLHALNKTKHWNLGVSIGRNYGRENTSWSYGWKAGINTAIFPRYSSSVHKLKPYLNRARDSSFSYRDSIYSRGILPSLQIGFVTSYQLYRPSLSLVLLANLGMMNHYVSNVGINYDNNFYGAEISSKGDFVAAYLKFTYPIGWNPNDDDEESK